MTYEDRLKRLERIAKLLIGAGLRMRKNITKLDGKIDLLINSQIRYEEHVANSRQQHDEKLAQMDEKIAIMIDAQIRYDEQLAQARREQEGQLTQARREQEQQLAQVRREQEEQLFRSRREQEEQITETRREFNVEIANLFKAQTRTEKHLAALAISQRQTDNKLNALIESFRKHQHGEVTG